MRRKSSLMMACGLCCTIFYIILISGFTNVSSGLYAKPYRPYKDVHTEYGIVRGRIAADGEYLAFLGIPYAAPPVGNMRFKDPAPPNSWEGVFDANRTVRCAQSGEGDEDCLIINVFTPIDTSEAPLPVLVYIHGGSYIIGSAPTKGVELLIKKNIMVVTMNYRLGVFGFLCLGLDDAPGNMGMKDQFEALKWVNRNIGNFGGDPENVTLHGMSAGSSSVHLHVLREESKGLFNKAIMESAATTSVFSFDPTPMKTAVDLAEKAMFEGDRENVTALLEFFQNTPADVLSKISYEFYMNFTNGRFGFVPTYERKTKKNNFLLQSPRDLIDTGKYNKMPMLIMFNTLEGLYLNSEKYYEAFYKDRMETDFANFMPDDLKYPNNDVRNKTMELTRQFYFGNDSIGDRRNLINFINFFGDYFVLNSLIDAVKQFSSNDDPVYLMEFAYKGNMGTYDTFYEHIKLAGHGDVVKHAILEKPIQTIEDRITVTRVVEIISNFVKYGNPIPMTSVNLPVRWPPVEPNHLNYLHMNWDLYLRVNPYPERIKFWDDLYSKYREEIKSPWI